MTAAEPLRPAPGPGATTWRLSLRVEPLGGDPVDAAVEIPLRDSDLPAVGGRVEVLHGPPPRRMLNWAGVRRSIEPVLLGAPPLLPPEPPESAAGDAGAPEGAPLGDVLRALARGLGDGSLAMGLPVVVEGVAPPSASPGGAPAGGSPGLEELARRAGGDPEGVAAEVERRLAAGEVTVAELLAAAAAARVPAADLAAVVAALRRRGVAGGAGG